MIELHCSQRSLMHFKWLPPPSTEPSKTVADSVQEPEYKLHILDDGSCEKLQLVVELPGTHSLQPAKCDSTECQQNV